MLSMVGSGSRCQTRRKVISTEYGSPVFTKTMTARPTSEPHLPYTEGKYPNWRRYSAYPPPPGDDVRFRGCNTVIDFKPKTEVKPTAVIPRCFRLHYVPRIFTWDLTAREHLTGLERLERFLLQFPISKLTSDPKATADYLYNAKLRKVDIGLLKWPKGYWNAFYIKECPLHILMEKGMRVKLERRIREEKHRIKEGFADITPGEWFAESESESESDSSVPPESDPDSLFGSGSDPSTRGSGFGTLPEFFSGSESGLDSHPSTPPRSSSTLDDYGECVGIWSGSEFESEVQPGPGSQHIPESQPMPMPMPMHPSMPMPMYEHRPVPVPVPVPVPQPGPAPQPKPTEGGDMFDFWVESSEPGDTEDDDILDLWGESPEPGLIGDDVFGLLDNHEPEPQPEPALGRTERDILGDLEWLEFLNISRKREGLGWSVPVVVSLVGKRVRQCNTNEGV